MQKLQFVVDKLGQCLEPRSFKYKQKLVEIQHIPITDLQINKLIIMTFCFILLTGHKHWVLFIAWSPDGRKLASGCKSSQVRKYY